MKKRFHGLKKRLWRWLHLELSSREMHQPPSAESTTTSSTFSSSPRWLLHVGVRICLDKLFSLLGQPAVDRVAVQTQLENLLIEIEQLKIPDIVLLSPFLCPDPILAKGRRLVLRIFEDAARKHSCHYVDVNDILQLEGLMKGATLFADPFHLGLDGHQVVGNELARVIAERCSEFSNSLNSALRTAPKSRQLSGIAQHSGPKFPTFELPARSRPAWALPRARLRLAEIIRSPLRMLFHDHY